MPHALPRVDGTPYDSVFYEKQLSGSIRSAEVILPILFRVFRPASVIDIGCGQGGWLAACAALGSTGLTGIDGDWVDRARMRHPGIRFVPADLGKDADVPIDGRHDLCISVEVAEHLAPERADAFVEALCRASDVVLFSAATRYQGGVAHVNEQRASYWAGKFDAHGYACVDLIRGAVWTDPRVEWWYRQNALVFVRRGAAAATAFDAAALPAPPLDIVHPDAFESKMAYLLPTSIGRGARTMNQTLRAILAVLAGLVAAALMIMLVERVGQGVYPLPGDLNLADVDGVKAYIMDMPAGAHLFVLAAWMVGTYLGGVVAGSVARRRPPLFAGIIAACILAGAIFNMVVLPHPFWMLAASVLGIGLAGWFAARTTERGFARAAARTR